VFRHGHYGVALGLYSPVGGSLLALGQPTAALAGGAGVLWLTMLPDWDHRLPLVSHRGPTHTLPFVAAVAGLAWLAAETVASGVGLDGYAVGPASLALGPVSVPVGLSFPAFAAGVAAIALLAHLAADLLTPMGVAVLWPVSDRRYSLGVATADDALWNYGLFALGVFSTAAAAYLGANLHALAATTLIRVPALLPL
jgi:inner membrane protein